MIVRTKRLTVGDMSGCNRKGKQCTIIRPSLADIAVGEVIEIRFKGECEMTPFKPYRLIEKHFRDEWDKSRGRYTGTFERVEPKEQACA